MADKDVSIFIKIKDLASKRIKDINKNLGRSVSAFRSFASRASSALRRVRMALNKIGTFLKRMPMWAKIASAAFVFYMGKKAVSAIIEVGAKYEQLYNRILVASRGLRDDTDKTWNKVLEFAAKSPLMTEPVVAAFATLKAAGVESAFEVTKSLSGLALMFNRDVSDLAGMFLGALQRVFRRMGIIIDRSGKKAVIQTAAWTEIVNKDIRSIWKGLAKVIDKSFGDALDIMRNTWTGTIKEMKGKWDVFLNSIARAGILDFLIATLKTANVWFDRLADAGKLDALAKKISDIMILMAKGLIGIVAQVSKVEIGFIRLRMVMDALDPGKIATEFRLKGLEKDLVGVNKQVRELKLKTKIELFGKKAMRNAIKDIKGISQFTKDIVAEWLYGEQTVEQINNALISLKGQQEDLKTQIKLTKKELGGSYELTKKLGDAEERNNGLLANFNRFLKEVEATLKGILHTRKQTVWEQERIRKNMAIQKRFEFLSNQANEKLNNLLKEQKQIRDSLLGATDEDIAKMEWVMSKLKEIKEKPKKFMTAEIIGLLQNLGKVVGEDLVRPILDEMARLRGARLQEMEVAYRGLPPGPPRVERQITTAETERQLALMRAREEVLKTAELSLTVNPRFINQIKVELQPGVEALSKELTEIFETNIDRMMELWRERHTQERMDLRAASVEADAIVGAP